MKKTCDKCGEELEVTFAVRCSPNKKEPNCDANWLVISVNCSKCGTENRFSRILNEKVDEKEVEKYMEKKPRYMG